MVVKKKTYFHSLNDGVRLRFDGRKVELGKWVQAKCRNGKLAKTVRACYRGMHACNYVGSIHENYYPILIGDVVCIVELKDHVQEHGDKVVALYRRVIAWRKVRNEKDLKNVLKVMWDAAATRKWILNSTRKP